MVSPRIRKVVIPVAGVGTRGLPFTKEVPKELLPIVDTPTIHFIVEEAVEAGIEQVIFVTSRGKSAIEDYFDRSPLLEQFLEARGKASLAARVKEIGQMCEVISVRQKAPLGLGHAVACAAPVIGNEPFGVCLGDEIFPNWEKGTSQVNSLGLLIKVCESEGKSVVGVQEIPREQTPSYGMIDCGGVALGDRPVSVLKTVEKPEPSKAPSPYALVGRYVFLPEIWECLRLVKPGVGGEIQLTDALDRIAKNGNLMAAVLPARRFDIGNHLSYIKAQLEAALLRKDLERPLREYLKTLC